ncbi:MAG: nucleoside triphosphate pyrophosphohydrolase [Boseongicola sp. SB0675_bin_26]|nr:nucleoside triphosphate pyrophosphohydrolase [Boseongicola sp. SB0675_bin_26]
MADHDPVHDMPDGTSKLIEVMRRLRDSETGCPWDIEQDFASIAPYTIEEAYEVADAIERESWDDLEGELGDLLLQVVYHCQMGSEEERFDLASVTRRICAKMIARHPHVFGSDSRDKSASEQSRDWETAKAAERTALGETRTLDGVALGLPALLRAMKLQKRLAAVGFDWEDSRPVLDKVAEEIAELNVAFSVTNDSIDEEFGDLLFSLVNLARHWGIDPEAALRHANAKVERRFASVEDRLAATGRLPAEATLAEMDGIWEAIKQDEKAQPTQPGRGT